MTGFTLDAHTELYGDLTGRTVSVAVLTDGSLLAAASSQSTTTLWHLTTDLTVTASTTTEGTDPTLYATPEGAVLLTDAGTTYAHRVTIDPLTITAQPALPTRLPLHLSAAYAPSPWYDHATDRAYVLRHGWLHVLDGTGTQVSAGPAPWTDPVTLHRSGTVTTQDGSVYSLDGSLHGSADMGWYPLTTTDPAADRWLIATEASGGPTVIDQSGAVVTTYGTATDYRVTSGSTAPDESGGGLGIAVVQAEDYTYRVYIDHLTVDDISHTRTPIDGGTSYWDPVGGGEAITQADGRWVAALVHAPPGQPYRLVVWAGTVPHETPTYDGILHIDTITHPHWLVGTADPDMDWRLHIDGLVEILAGQDDQATHRLRVCDGTEWPVAAYLRPE